ncbi:MAG: 23S rRNA (uracil(1939)-C(5))-methyltransferase RlmD, partial [Planctomycetes bacterium]|nr:23S rRNA (uracil(1939)-C(5))-methyltransferase RlmD [Planctomycetota bacterium]
RVLDLERCEIQTETANSILQTTSRIARTSERPAWNPRDHTGFWRFLIVRHALGTDSYLAHLVVSEDDRPRLDEWAEALVAAHPEVTSVSAGISNRVADTSEGAELVHLRGETGLIERVAGLSFEIAPQAFFQPNSHTAAILFDIVTDFAGLSEGDSVVDLFCGTGTLALGLARAGGRVRGYELSEPAVLCARRNAECNGLAERAQFEVRDLMKQVDSDMMHAEDVVVTDPPRAGMHDRAVRALIAARPRRIVHVGCNPKTQARDLAVLVRDGGYRIGRAVAVDQFPHTAHVECVVRLDQRP